MKEKGKLFSSKRLKNLSALVAARGCKIATELVFSSFFFLYLHFLQFNPIHGKVKTLWEGHKIWKNLPPVLTKQLFLLSSVKTSGIFFQIFVAFSEKLNFISLIFIFADQNQTIVDYLLFYNFHKIIFLKQTTTKE